MLVRSRERLVEQRTELVNAVRSALYEYGFVIPQGIANVRRVEEILDERNHELPDLVREECRDMLLQIAEKSDLIARINKFIKQLAAQTNVAQQLQTIPGVGPMTAIAIETFAPPMETFKNGRAFAAWLGLVPRQFSSGGKERLGGVSKAGQADIRRLLIIGAMTRMNWLGLRSITPGSWLSRMIARKSKLLTAIALANKMARIIWAMLRNGTNYRDPVPVLAV